MTRDEAIEIWRKTYCGMKASPADVSAKAIDGFVSLGILKLDEPKSAKKMAYAAIVTAGWSVGAASETIAILDRAGLKIVEK